MVALRFPSFAPPVGVASSAGRAAVGAEVLGEGLGRLGGSWSKHFRAAGRARARRDGWPSRPRGTPSRKRASFGRCDPQPCGQSFLASPRRRPEPMPTGRSTWVRQSTNVVVADSGRWMRLLGRPARGAAALTGGVHTCAGAVSTRTRALPCHQPLPHDGDLLSIRITPLTDPDRGPSSHRLAWLASGATFCTRSPAAACRTA
jgi:hypothetical protein